MLSTTCHVYFGKVMGATPNGRLAGRAISDGTSPSHGADTHGPSAVVKSLGKCPEDYRDLLVRVAGYSDYFNDMNADLQADVIARTEQETF